jgi:sec-independent protein translocase protein TatA
MPIAFAMPGWQEIIVIALVVLLIFGGSAKLPQLARSLGKAIREFKNSVKDVKKDVIEGMEDESTADEEEKDE